MSNRIIQYLLYCNIAVLIITCIIAIFYYIIFVSSWGIIAPASMITIQLGSLSNYRYFYYISTLIVIPIPFLFIIYKWNYVVSYPKKSFTILFSISFSALWILFISWFSFFNGGNIIYYPIVSFIVNFFISEHYSVLIYGSLAFFSFILLRVYSGNSKIYSIIESTMIITGSITIYGIFMSRLDSLEWNIHAIDITPVLYFLTNHLLEELSLLIFSITSILFIFNNKMWIVIKK